MSLSIKVWLLLNIFAFEDKLPLQVGEKGKSGPAAEHNWSDTASEDQPDSPGRSRQADHEYHEISDEEDEPLPRAVS